MGRNKMRKRYMVTEGELFQLYADIQEVRREERREEFMQRFRKLINEAQQVRMVIENMRK
ncbi:MAG: hypothetical protein IJD72_01555 [Alistipes sp.]|nr:hypothetical protein [Alistipes sp.]